MASKAVDDAIPKKPQWKSSFRFAITTSLGIPYKSFDGCQQSHVLTFLCQMAMLSTIISTMKTAVVNAWTLSEGIIQRWHYTTKQLLKSRIMYVSEQMMHIF